MIKSELNNIWRILKKKIKIKEGLGREYEYCVSHKGKHEIDIVFGGHHVIEIEYEGLNIIWRIFLKIPK